MAKKKFRLERVLHYREGLEKQEKIVLRGALEKVKQEKESLIILNQKKDQASNIPDGEVALLELKDYYEYLSWLKEDIFRQEMRVFEAEKELEKQREKFVKIRQERLVLEKLKEKTKAREKIEEEHREQKAIDEWGSLHYNGTKF